MTRGQAVGHALALLLALGVVWAAEGQWTWQLSDWQGWPLLSVAVLIGAWVNVAAWFARVWPLAIVCSLLSVFVPWGFVYFGPLTGVALAIAAAVAWVREARGRFAP